VGEIRKVDEASSLVSEKTRQDASSTARADTRQDASSTVEYRFFDPQDEIENVGGNLPHWRQHGVLYFVTFRTADALPAEKLRWWHAEREVWLATHPEPWDPATRADYLDRFPRRMQRWLDAGSGECLLARADLRTVVEGALQRFDGERYRLGEHHVAANHVHALVAPVPPHELSQILHSWKSYTASAINRATGRSGTFWQQESYDHIVRGEHALYRIERYIRNHPKPNVDEASSLVL
jgi:REP element-mobilizing transposase RayT